MINVQLEAARAVLAHDAPRARDALGKAQTLTREGLAEVRQSVAVLRASPVDRFPLPEAAAILVEECCAAGVPAQLTVAGTPRKINPRSKLALYRAAQEGLTNILKHAQASQAGLILDYSHPVNVRLTVQDNGVGQAQAAENGGFGLLGVRERVQLLGGEVRIDTGPGRGFKLDVEVPG